MNINSKKMIKQALVQLYASQAAVFVDKLFAISTLLILIPIRHIRTRTFTH